jgi:superfamily II DNA or RNA helicase
MLYEVEWAEDGTYVPGEEFSPERFFNDGLKNSTEFDLKLGYFSSAAISVLAEGFATFISKGGYMRLIINHIVSKKDKEAISDGMMGNVIDCSDLSNFQYLKTTFNEYEEQFFRCLAYMISQKRIDIRIIKPRGQKGIAHTKSGQFRDGDSTTAFTGSANFTISGLFNNIEEIKIDRSDSIDMMVQNRIIKQKNDFDAIMSGEKKGIEYLSSKDLVEAISTNYGDSDIEELLDVEKKLEEIKRNKQRESESPWCACEDIPEIEPSFPYEAPFPYQTKALDEWRKNDCKGLFNMATGTGKTITSLNCLLSLYKDTGCYKAIILVPTIPLVDQWEKECRKFDYTKIYKVSSKTDWKANITRLSRAELLYPDRNSFIVISTYASFVRKATFERLSEFSKDTLLIADEAHNMGSPSCLNLLDEIPYTKRIGLSATPERQFDEIGNYSICNFFGCPLNEYTFTFTMKEAIDRDYLCHYRYYPYLVELNEEEMIAYRELSAKIAKFYDPDNDNFSNNQILTALLLKRKRIIHKAQNKLGVFRSLVSEIYNRKKNLGYLLVYVPEGVDEYDHEFSFATESDLETEGGKEQVSLINQYTNIIASIDEHVTVEQVTSKSQNREKTLRRFASGDTQVLTAMKCLDEGVDVPRTEMAIFCASTGNPRQFIQRRGRILRTHKDKPMAYIYDLVVIPRIEKDSPFFSMERSMLKKELERVIDFASLSTNSSYAEKVLSETIEYYNLNLYCNE